MKVGHCFWYLCNLFCDFGGKGCFRLFLFGVFGLVGRWVHSVYVADFGVVLGCCMYFVWCCGVWCGVVWCVLL